MNYKRPLLGLACSVTAAMVLGLVWHFAPQRVVEREFVGLLRALEKRDWKRVTGHLAESYEDPWHENRRQTVAQLAEVFRQFFWLEIRPIETQWQRLSPQEFLLITRLELTGEGTALASLVVQEANNWPGKFTLRYVRQSRFPGDWKLQEAQPHPPPTW